MMKISGRNADRMFGLALWLGALLHSLPAVAATNLPAQYFVLLNTGIVRVEKRLEAEPAADLQALESAAG